MSTCCDVKSCFPPVLLLVSGQVGGAYICVLETVEPIPQSMISHVSNPPPPPKYLLYASTIYNLTHHNYF